MGKFLALAAVTVALNVFAPLAHAQDYVVNGHAASKAEAHFLASYSAQPGNWAPPIAQTSGRKCWYVLDVQLCD